MKKSVSAGDLTGHIGSPSTEQEVSSCELPSSVSLDSNIISVGAIASHLEVNLLAPLPPKFLRDLLPGGGCVVGIIALSLSR